MCHRETGSETRSLVGKMKKIVSRRPPTDYRPDGNSVGGVTVGLRTLDPGAKVTDCRRPESRVDKEAGGWWSDKSTTSCERRRRKVEGVNSPTEDGRTGSRRTRVPGTLPRVRTRTVSDRDPDVCLDDGGIGRPKLLVSVRPT